MPRENITITEGEADPDNRVDVDLAWISGGWATAFKEFYEQPGISQNDLTDWLIDRLDAPETVSAAIEDDRVYVKNVDDEYAEPEIQMFNGQVAWATYHEDNAEWIVEILM